MLSFFLLLCAFHRPFDVVRYSLTPSNREIEVDFLKANSLSLSSNKILFAICNEVFMV